MTTVYLEKSTNKSKKYMVTIVNESGTEKKIHFGANGYSDFTIHKDPDRMKRYDARHKTNENWTKSGIYTAGFWSKWILWSKPSLIQAIKYTSQKFGIKIKRSKPAKSSTLVNSPKTTRSPKRRVYKSRLSPRKLLF
tara:strand:+ start:1408 stop:1818 length:411 start_codon:yes stop_codon:yes gene_type:complete